MKMVLKIEASCGQVFWLAEKEEHVVLCKAPFTFFFLRSCLAFCEKRGTIHYPSPKPWVSSHRIIDPACLVSLADQTVCSTGVRHRGLTDTRLCIRVEPRLAEVVVLRRIREKVHASRHSRRQLLRRLRRPPSPRQIPHHLSVLWFKSWRSTRSHCGKKPGSLHLQPQVRCR